jgi:hypothetical protein
MPKARINAQLQTRNREKFNLHQGGEITANKNTGNKTWEVESIDFLRNIQKKLRRAK